jgi:hypothetical protein
MRTSTGTNGHTHTRNARAKEKPLAAESNGHGGNGRPPSNAGSNGDHDARTWQFVAGNRSGCGNPSARKMAKLRATLLRCVGEAEVAKLGQKLLAASLRGDWVAAKLLLGYLVGRPGLTPDPDRLDKSDLDLLLSAPPINKLACALLAGMEPAVALRIARDALLNPDRDQFVRDAIVNLVEGKKNGRAESAK